MDLRISRQNISRNQTGFKGSKALNLKLKQMLANQPKSEYFDRISNLNDFCNGLEESIDKKIGQHSNMETNPLIEMLVATKTVLAGLIDNSLPKLHYLQKEQMAYHKESLTNKSSWKCQLAASFEEKIEELYKVGDDGGDLPEKPNLKIISGKLNPNETEAQGPISEHLQTAD